MSLRTSLMLLALLSAPTVAAPAQAQVRAPTISSPGSPGPVQGALDSGFRRNDGGSSPRRTPGSRVARTSLDSTPWMPAFATERFWRERKGFEAGVIAGVAVGAGLAVRKAFADDLQCRGEVTAFCWVEYEALVLAGAWAGAFFGWIASLPPKSAAQRAPIVPR